MYYYDWTYVLVLIGAVICLIAQAGVKSTYKKYSKVANSRGITGAMVAEKLLLNAGINDVSIQCVSGELTDHYDPTNKTVNLSNAVYNGRSIASLSVAAHECGHVMQHAENYTPLSLRTTLVPLANFGSKLAWPLIIIGLLFARLGEISTMFIEVGIIMFSLAVLFQIVTLPVEFNASSRALKCLQDQNWLTSDEMPGARKVLRAAAMTYVASAAAAILQLLRLILILNNSRSSKR